MGASLKAFPVTDFLRYLMSNLALMVAMTILMFVLLSKKVLARIRCHCCECFHAQQIYSEEGSGQVFRDPITIGASCLLGACLEIPSRGLGAPPVRRRH